MMHPNDLYMQRRRRTRLLLMACGAVLAIFIFNAFSSSSRDDYLSKASITMLEGYVKGNPGDNEASYRLAFKLVEEGKNERAQTIMDKLIHDHPKSAMYQYGLGRVLHARGNVSASFPHFLSAAALDPQFTKAHLSIASLCSKAGLHTEAVQAYARAEAQGMSADSDMLGWARSHAALGQDELVWARMMNYLRRPTLADELYPLITEVGMRLKRYDELEDVLIRRMKMTQAYSVLPARAGLLRTILAQKPSPVVLEAAEKMAREGFTVQGVEPEFLAAFAELLLARNKVAEARKSLSDGLKTDPNNTRCLEVLSSLERRAGSKNRAVEIEAKVARLKHITPDVIRLREEVARAPKNARARVSLGDALMNAGDPGQANEAYHAADALAPNDPQIVVVLERSRVAALRLLDSKLDASSYLASSHAADR